MKKPIAVNVADEPMGIVIAMGNRGRAQAAPQVRAYYWFSYDEQEASVTENRSTT